jgi:hypothetical protein
MDPDEREKLKDKLLNKSIFTNSDSNTSSEEEEAIYELTDDESANSKNSDAKQSFGKNDIGKLFEEIKEIKNKIILLKKQHTLKLRTLKIKLQELNL